MNSEHKPAVVPPTHWANLSEAGASFGMFFLLTCFKVGGRPLFRTCLLPVIFYFFLFRKQARTASMNYIQRLQSQGVLPNNRLKTKSFLHFWNFSNSLIDKFAVWMKRITLDNVIIEGEEIINELFAAKQGAVIVMSHLGNFEICRCLSGRHKNFKLTVLMHTHHAQKFNQLLEKHTDSSHIDILQVTEMTPATAMLLNERIDRGEFIAIAGDRVPVGNPENSLLVDFLGSKAPIPAGPFTLASILRAPLISLFCIKEKNTFRITFQWLKQDKIYSRKERKTMIAVLASRYAQQLEQKCKQQPLQWFNFFEFWQQPSSLPTHVDSLLNKSHS